jgi:hypothetical protein
MLLMKPVRSFLVAWGVAFLIGRSPVEAHHSFAAEFDASQPITLTGVVSVLQWTNPHTHILLNVVEREGLLTSWDLELAPPNALIRRGWPQSGLDYGDKISVRGYRARDASHRAKVLSVVFGDGRALSAY